MNEEFKKNESQSLLLCSSSVLYYVQTQNEPQNEPHGIEPYVLGIPNGSQN